MGGVKKAIKKVTGGSVLNALFDPGRHFINTKEDEAAKQAAEQAAQQAARERAMFEQQQRQLQEANMLSASKVNDSVAKIETGAGTDVGSDIGLGDSGPKKKKATASATLGVM